MIAEDKLVLPRGTSVEDVEIAGKENYNPETATIIVSPPRSVHSQTHVEISTTLSDFKTDLDFRLEEMEQRMVKKVEEGLRKLRPFIKLGVDILMRSLEDMSLEKMRRYTNISRNAPYSFQVDCFTDSFISCLTPLETDQLRNSIYRHNANTGAHQDAMTAGAKESMTELVEYLEENGPANKLQLAKSLVNFVWGPDNIRRRR